MPNRCMVLMSRFRGAVTESGLQYHAGLKALGGDSNHIEPADTRAVTGSAHIDSDLKAAHPNTPRWDYAIGYGANKLTVHYVEVHEARTRKHAREVLNKLRWLKDWLDTAPLGTIRRRRFHWAATGKVDIPKTNHELKQLAEQGIKMPTRIVKIADP